MFVDITVPLAMDLLILTFGCSPVSSTTPSFCCLLSSEFALIMDFVVTTLRNKSSWLLTPAVLVPRYKCNTEL